MEIISKSNDKFKLMKEMIKTNHYPKITVTDDLQVLKIALDNNLKIKLLLFNYEEEYQEETQKLLDGLISISDEAYQISASTYNLLKLKENHAGIICAIEMPEYTMDDFKNKEFLLVLDRLEIPGNIGTIYRTIEAIKIDGVILVDQISKLNNEKITSSSRGCNLIIPTLSLSYDDAQKFLLDNNYDIYLGEPKLGLNYQEYDYKNKVAIVVGNERFGINNNWYNNKNKKVFIPMEGSINSLNVGVAASILIYEAYMKRKA